MIQGNQAVEQRLKTCLTAVQRLKTKGCFVRNVNLGRALPLIEIERPCRPLPGTQTAIIENSPKGRIEYKTTRFASCLVRWKECP
ncbi:hypothetical protein [Ferrimonas sp.]|uniref:hypothetical protein n=1 Tax=Ferrimonas sp. TaxID=2080861 RepID=UPI003A95B4BF